MAEHKAAVYLGVRTRINRRLVRHKIAVGASLVEYPKPPYGPGGHFAYALCGEPAYLHDGAVHLGSTVECADCSTIAAADAA